ncbi:hypothetical protein BGX20_001742, partial [Mortierella sp. AD010]
LRNTMANNPLSLLCLVNDKPRSDAFEVEIESTKSVSALKDLIKTEKANDLRDVNAENSPSGAPPFPARVQPQLS